jgi:hypothetical protein
MEAARMLSGRGAISVGDLEKPIPVVYRDVVEGLQVAEPKPAIIYTGFLIIDDTREALATLFVKLSLACCSLRLGDGRWVKFRLFGQNSYDAAKDPALVVSIRLTEAIHQ